MANITGLGITNATLHADVKHGPTQAEIWGYSFLCMTVINLCAVAGAIFLPLRKHWLYEYVMMYMISLAVGTICGVALLFLLPDAFGLTEPAYIEKHGNYAWKSLVIIGGIVLFFNTERVLKILVERQKDDDDAEEEERREAELKMKLMADAKHEEGFALNGSTGAVTKPKKKRQIASLAWMIILGDGFHSFADGMSIGAAFTENISLGVSISVAVFCEELPHKLGDIALLLASGMGIKEALAYNGLYAVLSYIGLVLGIVLSETTNAAPWIFSVAGGMFLYLALVDILPEVNKMAENVRWKRENKAFLIYMLQNLGMITGFGIMVIMALFGGEIKV